jgi:hypothetical protein
MLPVSAWAQQEGVRALTVISRPTPELQGLQASGATRFAAAWT